MANPNNSYNLGGGNVTLPDTGSKNSGTPTKKSGGFLSTLKNWTDYMETSYLGYTKIKSSRHKNQSDQTSATTYNIGGTSIPSWIIPVAIGGLIIFKMVKK